MLLEVDKRLAAAPEDRTQYDWFGQARIHETQGEYDEALKAYDKALNIDPKFAKAWFYKAKLYYMLDKKKEAKECIEKVLELEPKWKKHVEKYMPEL